MDVLQPEYVQAAPTGPRHCKLTSERYLVPNTAVSHLSGTQGIALVSEAAESHKTYKINV